MAKCQKCGKGPQYGHRVSHSKRRTKHKFKVNIQTKRIMIDGVKKKVRWCTKCLKKLNPKGQTRLIRRV